ncbi:MAG: PIN domain-containing protein [Nostoc sp.]
MIRRVLVDIDILLDILLDREPFVEDSVKLWELIESEQIEGYVTPTTINKIFDIGR